jgi:N,N'-diacetyllegionaminate synthase
MTNPVPIVTGSHTIGPGHPCFLVAEIGINHNGDLDLAKTMIQAASAAGADAGKFQNYRTEDFLSDRSLTYTYTSQGRQVTESQWDMFKRYEPKSGWLEQLKCFCDERGIVFFSTPTSEEGVDDLMRVGVPLLKNGSDYLTHLPLLEHMGRTGVPVIVSTGMADQQDVDDAVRAVHKGRSPLMLMHCTSSYPTPCEHVNLRRMVTMYERYATLVGFSDHTEGWCAAVQATTLGACMIEKHFTLDHNLAGPDHWFSSMPADFSELVRQVRLAESRLGAPDIVPAAVEQKGREEYRLSIVAAEDLDGGTIMTPALIRLRRPGTGILARDLDHYLNRRLVRSVSRGTPLQPSDFGTPEA